MHINNVGTFDDVTKEIDIDKVNQSVEEKIRATSEKEIAKIEVSDQFLGHTPEGDLVVISNMRITYYLNKEEGIESKVGSFIATIV